MADASDRSTPSKPKRKKRPATPSARTKQALEARGWIVDKCEQRLNIPLINPKTGKPNPFAHVTRDLFNMFDFIGLAPWESLPDDQARAHKGNYVIVGIQVSTHTNHASHRDKIKNNAIHLRWEAAGGLILLQTWGKTGKRGEVKTVTLREEWL